MTFVQFVDIVEYVKREIGSLCGLAACVSAAILGVVSSNSQWHDYVLLTAVGGAAASGYLLKPFRSRDAETGPWKGTDSKPPS